jgi:superfamily II DNA/RNA helicase
VLHVGREDRVAVLADLTAAPGRTVVFTRTKHGAKALARQLSARGVPTVELHGNLSQGARTRNLEAFGDGSATTLVATDIAARGIHVDDVGLVVHADPPVEHKAYLHRSGRTARAGAEGTVVTLMLDAQVSDVRDLTRKAGIKPTITRARPGDAVLEKIAPGERTYVAAAARPASEPQGPARSGRRRGAPKATGTRTQGGGPRRSGSGSGAGSSSSRSTSSRSSASRSGGGSPARGTAQSGRSHSAAGFSSSRLGR